MEEFNEMARKREPRKVEEFAKEIIGKYKPKAVEDMQNALKDIFGPMFKAMLNGEMDNHLGYGITIMDQNPQATKETAT